MRADTESDRCCGTERVWLARLPQTSGVARVHTVASFPATLIVICVDQSMHEGSSHAAKLTMDNTHREEEIKRLKSLIKGYRDLSCHTLCIGPVPR